MDIEIIDDRILEANESFSVTFMLDSRASKDILLGYTTTAEVIILDFDGAHVLHVTKSPLGYMTLLSLCDI